MKMLNFPWKLFNCIFTVTGGGGCCVVKVCQNGNLSIIVYCSNQYLSNYNGKMENLLRVTRIIYTVALQFGLII